MTFSPSPEEIAAFRAAIDDVVPLPDPARVFAEPPKPSPRPLQRERDEKAVLTDSLHGPLEIDDFLALEEANAYLRPGLPRNILRDLRRGRWSIQKHTDLHGMNRHEAHQEITRFLAESKTTGKRCLRIVHGRGLGSPGREGILKKLVKSWLIRRNDVLAFCHAPACDGGEGALWVLLKSDRAETGRFL